MHIVLVELPAWPLQGCKYMAQNQSMDSKTLLVGIITCTNTTALTLLVYVKNGIILAKRKGLFEAVKALKSLLWSKKRATN
jgi:hypothetical protein